MEHNIPEIRNSRKVKDMVLVLIVVLLALCSFGLGRLSKTAEAPHPVALCAGTALQVQATSTAEQAYTQGRYVASKNGSVYHFPWCSGAKRILDENRISFDTREAAEKAGYRPAQNCKGL